MKIVALTPQDNMFYAGWTHKVIVDYTDVPAGTTVQTLKIFPKSSGTDKLPVGWMVKRTGYVLNTLFVSASLATLTVSIGDVASNTTFLAAQSILTGVTPITYALSSNVKAYTSATEQIQLAFTPTVANMNTLTAGQLLVLLAMGDLNDAKIPL